MADARAALADAAARLAAVSETPRLDAELLLAHALGVERSALLLDMAQIAPPSATFGFNDEVQFFLTLIIDDHSPVGVIGTKRCRNFEPGR